VNVLLLAGLPVHGLAAGAAADVPADLAEGGGGAPLEDNPAVHPLDPPRPSRGRKWRGDDRHPGRPSVLQPRAAANACREV
jgi:hypothetical protein